MKICNKKESLTHYCKRIKSFSSPDILAIKSNFTTKSFGLKVGPELGSDNLPMSICIKGNLQKTKIINKPHWKFDKMDKKEYARRLDKNIKNIEKDILSTSVDRANTLINEKLLKTTKELCKKSKDRVSFRGNQWWDDQCDINKKAKNKAWRTFLRMRTQKNENTFRKQNKLFRRVVIKAKNTYYNKLFENGDERVKYKIFKALSSNTNNCTKRVRINSIECTDTKIIANNICKYFSDIGGTPCITESKLATYRTGIITNNDNLVLNRKIEDWEFVDICRKLNPKKAEGIDLVCPFMIKYSGESLIKSLGILFNKSFDKGIIPKNWYRSIIIPIPKNNDKILEVDKFRPISLTPTISKIMERIVNNRLKIMVEHKKIIPSFQKGFRKHMSTFDNLNILKNVIVRTFKEKKIMIACFLDIKKAYDTVNRDKLIKMLKEIGLQGKIFSWLKQFLQPRKSRVIYENTQSQEIEFKNGVPQGSPLSPLLFNIYIKELGNIKNLNISQFADDIVIWETGNEINLIERELNIKLKKIGEVLNSLELKLSVNKCMVTTFTRRKNIREPKIMINNIKLKNKKSVKYLGIIFDTKLSWNDNTRNILNKAHKRLGILKYFSRNTNNIHQSSMLNLYKLFIRPVLEYGSEIWGGGFK